MPMPINPRLLLNTESGKQELFDRLCEVGYTPLPKPFHSVCNAIRRRTSIRLEGERGGGKTAFAEFLSSALNLPIYILSCLHDTTTAHILFSWDSSAQHHFVGLETMKGISLEVAREKQWTFDFLKMGECLDAFHFASRNTVPPILLIDEIDKLKSDAQSALLQLLARGYANVPLLRPDSRVGITPEMSVERRNLSFPIVILTSNDGDKVTSPLKSRSRYSIIKTPEITEMVRVLVNRVPNASPKLLYQTAKLILGISGLPLIEKPALREYLELLETFVDYGYKNITLPIIEENMDCLAKHPKDVDAMYDAAEMLYVNYVELEDTMVFDLVSAMCAEKNTRQKKYSKL